MSVGEMLRKQNKHRKIIFKFYQNWFEVVRLVNTLEVVKGDSLNEEQVQKLIDRGFTVEVK
ncbi:MAG: hypothetical protein KAV87_13145 [Desulfobacteraceae bacterium]|nr:hypothetical protein [Desulfobacteraceae bacterium]